MSPFRLMGLTEFLEGTQNILMAFLLHYFVEYFASPKSAAAF